MPETPKMPEGVRFQIELIYRDPPTLGVSELPHTTGLGFQTGHPLDCPGNLTSSPKFRVDGLHGFADPYNTLLPWMPFGVFKTDQPHTGGTPIPGESSRL